VASCRRPTGVAACSTCWAQFPTSGVGRDVAIPSDSLLAVLILAAMNGESSPLGMWLLSKAHAQLSTARPSFHRQRIPALETSRTIVCQLDRVLLLEAFNAWLAACDAECTGPAAIASGIQVCSMPWSACADTGRSRAGFAVRAM
jgi:hypothetical protein